MRWKGRQGSSNVEDRRGGRGGGGAGRKFGLGTIVIIIIALIFGQDPMAVLDQLQSGGPAPTTQTSTSAPSDEFGEFASVVLKDTEDVWDKLFRENNATYTV